MRGEILVCLLSYFHISICIQMQGFKVDWRPSLLPGLLCPGRSFPDSWARSEHRGGKKKNTLPPRRALLCQQNPTVAILIMAKLCFC